MPYCPKCGIEVENGKQNCPLCRFSIPYVDEQKKKEEMKYPVAKSNYDKNVQHMKNTAFITLTAVMLTAGFLMLFIEKTLFNHWGWSLIVVAALFVVEMLFASFWGYLKSFTRSLIYSLFSVLILLWVIDRQIGHVDWFLPLGAPIAIILALIIWLLVKIGRKFKDKGLNVAAISLIGVGAFSLICEGLTSLYFSRHLHFWWSLVVNIALLPISFLLLYLHYGLPEKYKEWFYKNFHF